jgi:hypothetical protein
MYRKQVQMSQPSFDIDINGITFTLAPICADTGECQQYSVMTDDHIFRMNYDDLSASFKIAHKEALPADIGDLEQYLSNAILNNEKSSSIS